MRLNCPICGDRDASEFTYLGDASRTMPPLDADTGDWTTHVYERANPMGRHREYWQHSGGCRAVLTVERDTVTHKVLSVWITGPQAAIQEDEAGP